MPRNREDNVNPPHNTIRHEPPEVTKVKAYQHHRLGRVLALDSLPSAS